VKQRAWLSRGANYGRTSVISEPIAC